MAIAIHWDLAGKCGFERNERSYDHGPEIVRSENDDYKHLWDFSIPPDHEIEARRLDLVIINKRDKSYQNMEVAIPKDGPGWEKRKMGKLKNIKIFFRSSKTEECNGGH